MISSDDFILLESEVVFHRPTYPQLGATVAVDHPPSGLSARSDTRKRALEILRLKVYKWELERPIELDPEDLRIECWVTGGLARWINSGSPGVRVTHTPTGLFASEDGDRSQHRNKANAVKLLTQLVKEHHMKNKVPHPLKEFKQTTRLKVVDESNQHYSLGEQVAGALFKREGAICMAVRLCNTTSAQDESLALGNKAIINLQTGSVWIADKGDVVYPVEAILTLKEV